ncbi:MAG TPA: ribonuclease E inhibitor RraB [Steroidobacteraceae bacterium]|nr:ribonuclease E inhibitor RraB [Steroidobacteraceae bacterium]
MSGRWVYLILIVAAVLSIGRVIMTIRKARKLALHDDWDSQLVKNLRAAGGNAFTPYQVDFFFTLPDEAACGSLRGLLEPEGFAVESRVATGEAATGYSVHARKQLRVTVSEMQEHSKRFRALAEQFGGYYDGWMTDPSRTA